MISVALVAYAACDTIHELLGHGVACALIPGVRALSISTVALQTSAQSRLVAAAGSIVNVLVGVVLLVLFRSRKRFDSMGYFLWLLATLNLMNGTGYLLFSGILGVGDWSVVIAGLEPQWVWRTALVVLGALTYWGVVSIAAAALASLVRSGHMDRRDARRLVYPAYIAGGLLLVAGAALNPISPSLILMSGASSGFGAMAGLLGVPGLVEGRTSEAGPGAQGIRLSWAWAIAALLACVLFVGLLGPGIRLSAG